MSVELRGDFKALKKFEQQLRDVPQVLRAISANMAEEAIELIREGFEHEQDPTGRRWKPLQARKGRILQDTGRLRNSFHRKHMDDSGFTVGPAVNYATFHQTGTRRGLPARKMVPEQAQPPKWRRRLEQIAADVLDEYFED